MKQDSFDPKIIFLDQVSGPMFRELADDLSKIIGRSLLYTGDTDSIRKGDFSCLTIISAPNYNRSNNYLRFYTWTKYFICAFFMALRQPRSSLIFIVSNPPILSLIGYAMKKLRRQKYVVLVYDIYPDILIKMNVISKNGLLARLWRRLNKLTWENAEAVFTIGDCLAANIEKMYNPGKTYIGKSVVIPTWADSEFIQPIAKEQNWFAAKFQQIDKLTILYSGNLGKTHNLGPLLFGAKALKDEKRVHFLIIGDGARRLEIENFIKEKQVNNMTLLPYQPEDILPYSMSTGDVAIVALDKGIEGLSMPSKSFYYMAAGCAILLISEEENEIKNIINIYKCGINVDGADNEAFVKAVKFLLDNPDKLNAYKKNARLAVEKVFNRKRCVSDFASYLQKILSFRTDQRFI